MKGLIILDGPDGAGKTTLGKRICERYGGKYFHLTYRWKAKMFEYHTAALHHAISLSTKQLVVIDRLWMSEIIYATVYRQGSQWPHIGRMMDRVIRKHAGMYVLCFDESMKSHQDRFMKLKAEREEMYSDTTDVWALYHSLYHGGLDLCSNGNDYFEDIAKGEGFKARGDCWKYSLDVDGRDMDSYIDRLLACHQLRRSEQIIHGVTPGFHNFLGYAPEAKYLFVGDTLSDKRFRSIGWPFYAYQHSSLYVTQQLSKMGFDETHACWVNRHNPHGIQLIRDLTGPVHNLKPIFFGIEALSGVSHDDLNNKPFATIRHPQFYNRFRHNEMDFFVDLTRAMRSFDEL